MKVHHPAGGFGSLKLRLVVAFCASFALCAGVLLSLLAHHQSRSVSTLLSEHAAAVAASVAALAHDQVAANNPIGLPARLETFNEMTMIRSLAITDRQGTPLAAVRRNAAGNMTATPINELGELGTPGVERARALTTRPNQEAGIMWASIGKFAPIGWVRLEYETDRLAQTTDDWLANRLLVLIVITLAGALIAYALAHSLSKSLTHLTLAARTLGSSEFAEIRSNTAHNSQPREIAEVMSALNDASDVISALNSNWSHNQDQYRRMLLALADPVVEIDADLRIIHANPAWQRIAAHAATIAGTETDSIAAQLNGTELEHLMPGIFALVRGASAALHERIRISESGCCSESWFRLDGYRLLDQHGNFASLLLHAVPMKAP